MALTLLIGGARSGKSSLAVDIGHRHQAAGFDVTYIATAPVTDDDMATRIERHRHERPQEWATIEEQVDLVGAMTAVERGLIIIDCLTLWTSNLMWHELADDEIVERAHVAATFAADRDDPIVAITNEVGSGVHPPTELGRRYRDVLGRVNHAWAALADPALLVVAGHAVQLTDPWDTLEDPR